MAARTASQTDPLTSLYMAKSCRVVADVAGQCFYVVAHVGNVIAKVFAFVMVKTVADTAHMPPAACTQSAATLTVCMCCIMRSSRRRQP